MLNIEEQKKYLVEMSQALNTMRNGYATLQEQRLFLIYLSRINARDKKRRALRIPLSEFIQICDVKVDQSIEYYKKISTPLMQKLIDVPLPSGGFFQYVLFTACRVDQDKETGEWYFEICANHEADNLFFNLSKYVSFQIENALNLRSVNQIRLYTLLKSYAYERCGFELIIELFTLRDILGIGKEEYVRYGDFNDKILKVCQKEINGKTDIIFTYKPAERRAKGKIYSIHFKIKDKDVVEKSKVVATVAPSDVLSSPQTSPSRPSVSSLSFEQLNTTKPKINLEDIENARNNPLWEYAIEAAQRNEKVSNYLAYATGILNNWERMGCKSYKDLIRAGIIKEVKEKARSYSLDGISDVF